MIKAISNRLLTAATLIAGLVCSGVSAASTPTEISYDEAAQIALAEVPGGVVEEIERKVRRGKAIFEIEVRAPDGLEHELTIDAHDGEILDEEIDD